MGDRIIVAVHEGCFGPSFIIPFMRQRLRKIIPPDARPNDVHGREVACMSDSHWNICELIVVALIIAWLEESGFRYQDNNTPS